MNRGNDVQTCDLLGLLEGKLDAFEVFLSTTALLRDADFQEMEKIETFIAKRGNCIKVIEGIDSRINEIRNSIPALPGEIAGRIRTLTKAIDDTAVEAAHLNKEFETIFMLQRNDLKNKVSKIPAFAGMTISPNRPSFPRRRESRQFAYQSICQNLLRSYIN
jgi:hypothetical protein